MAGETVGINPTATDRTVKGMKNSIRSVSDEPGVNSFYVSIREQGETLHPTSLVSFTFTEASQSSVEAAGYETSETQSNMATTPNRIEEFAFIHATIGTFQKTHFCLLLC